MSEVSDKKNKPQLTIEQKIRNRIMDHLARRDHSEKELRKKLREKFEDHDAIEKAIEFVKEKNLLCDPKKLAEQMSNMLHRRKKGTRYIQNYLKEKGLPQVSFDDDLELQKAKDLILKKFKSNDRSKSTLLKISRFLQSRGFTGNIISKILFSKDVFNEE